MKHLKLKILINSKRNSTEEYRNDEQMYLDEKQNNHRNIRDGCSYLIGTLSLIFIFSSFVYVIIYSNSNNNFIKSFELTLCIYIISIFINILSIILNSCLYLDSSKTTNNFKQCIKKFLKSVFLNYVIKLYIIVKISKLLRLINCITMNNKPKCSYFNNFFPDTIFILIILIIIGNAIEQIRIFLKNNKILEKYKSNKKTNLK